MKASDLYEMVKQGKQPLVQFKDTFFDEAFCEKGMIARVMSAGMSRFNDDGYEFKLSYMDHKAHNMALQATDWRIYKDGKEIGTGTAIESGAMSEDDLTEDMYMDQQDDEIPADYVEDGLVMEYANANFSGTYVDWLEQAVMGLRLQLGVSEVAE